MGTGSYWDGETWVSVPVDSPFDKSRTFVQATDPGTSAPVRKGDLFVDTDTDKAQYFNGTGWLNLKADTAVADVSGLASELALLAPKASPTFTGTVIGITKSMVGLGNVDNTTDLLKPVSTATAAAIAALTKSSVGLANVNDTSDANKPVSTAQATAIGLKADKAGPTFTGTVTIPTAAAGTNTTAAASTAYVQAELTTLDASHLTLGTIALARIPTGTLVTQVALGNHTHILAAGATDVTATATQVNFLGGATPVTSSVQQQLNNKQATGSYSTVGHTHTKSNITDFAHTHPVSELSDFATTVSGTLAGNNYYEKYANGQLICRGSQSFATGSQAYTWTYPVAFVGQLPQIITNHGTTAPESLASAHSSDSLSSVIIEHNRSTAGSTTLQYMAIGRWK